MITALDLEPIGIFASLSNAEREELARKAGDVRLLAGDFLNREGQVAFFHILLDGQLSLHKNFNGRYQELRHYGKYQKGDFSGEVPILLGARVFAILKADMDCRVARFEAQHFHKLIREFPKCREAIMEAFTQRMSRLAHHFAETVHTRVVIVGSEHSASCREIRHFLTLSRIHFEWIDRDKQPDRVPDSMPKELDDCSVLVDDKIWVSHPLTIRRVAEALGIRTWPKSTHYDVVVVGGGPAGLTASVYGASEGLSVLLVDRNAVGGQAGHSTCIENYLGFPDGVSGDDLGERAFRQAQRFGADIVTTREVTRIERLSRGAYSCQLDGGERVISESVVLATGVNWRCVGIAGIDRLLGRGVLYGAAKTEASTVIGKSIFIVGGGNSAGQASIFFASYAKSVTILVRGEGLKRTMSQYLVDQIARTENITVAPYTEVVSVEGKDHLESITIQTRDGEQEKCSAHALFILIGATANTDWLPKDLERDRDGFVRTGLDVSDLSGHQADRRPYPLETSLPGFFCIGDVRHGSIKRVSSSVGEGSMAIASIHQYIATAKSPQHA